MTPEQEAREEITRMIKAAGSFNYREEALAGRRGGIRLHHGYDGRGQVFVNRLVDERGCSAMLTRREPEGV